MLKIKRWLKGDCKADACCLLPETTTKDGTCERGGESELSECQWLVRSRSLGDTWLLLGQVRSSPVEAIEPLLCDICKEAYRSDSKGSL